MSERILYTRDAKQGFEGNGGVLVGSLVQLAKAQKKGTFTYSKDNADAKEAILDYKIIKYNEEINLSVAEITLHTGRHHQIRVQFSSRNHSLYGDQKYGTRGRGKQLALWAYSLSILHPITKERMEFKAYPEKIGSWKILED